MGSYGCSRKQHAIGNVTQQGRPSKQKEEEEVENLFCFFLLALAAGKKLTQGRQQLLFLLLLKASLAENVRWDKLLMLMEKSFKQAENR